MIRAAVACAIVLMAAATARAAEPLTVGAKADPRHRAMAAVTARYVAAHGIPSEVAPGYSAPILAAAHRDGAVDLAWEGIGIALTTRHDIDVNIASGMDRAAARDKLRAVADDGPIAWPAAAPARGGSRLVVAEHARRTDTAGPELSELFETVAGQAESWAVPSRFLGRRDGLVTLLRRHGDAVPRHATRRLPQPRIFRAVQAGDVRAAVLPANDARTARAPVVPVADDGLPPQQLVAGIRRDHPASTRAGALAARLARAIDGAALRRWTAALTRDGDSLHRIAARTTRRLARRH